MNATDLQGTFANVELKIQALYQMGIPWTHINPSKGIPLVK